MEFIGGAVPTAAALAAAPPISGLFLA